MKDDKILQEEKLSDEELEKVSGGTNAETADDSRFLNVLLHKTTKYHQCDRYGSFKIYFDTDARNDVIEAWKSLGIDLQHSASSNEYYLNGEKISRTDAWAHAEKLVGKHLTKEQWNW